MNYNRAYRLLKQIGFTRIGGSAEELTAANILLKEIEKAGGKGILDPFELQSQKNEVAKLEMLTPFKKSYEVSAYGCGGVTEKEGITAPFYYMEIGDEVDKVKAKNKIVLINGYLNYKAYKALNDAGALAFITFSGDAVRDTFFNSDLEKRELRAALHQKFGKIPGVHMRAQDALDLVNNNPKLITITVLQEETTCTSHNVITSIEGSEFSDEIIIFTAHYDSVIHSKGVYDNGAGSVILMELYRHFLIEKPKRTLKFIWCGSEERGLQGAKHYVNTNPEELKNILLCINVDVGAAVLGKELAICTSDLSLKYFVQYLAKMSGIPLEVTNDIYSSDSIPFADKGIPGINFARFGAPGGAHIHNRFDNFSFLSAKALEKTGDIALMFADSVINAVAFPVPRSIPENIVKKIDEYLYKTNKEEQ